MDRDVGHGEALVRVVTYLYKYNIKISLDFVFLDFSLLLVWCDLSKVISNSCAIYVTSKRYCYDQVMTHPFFIFWTRVTELRVNTSRRLRTSIKRIKSYHSSRRWIIICFCPKFILGPLFQGFQPSKPSFFCPYTVYTLDGWE